LGYASRCSRNPIPLYDDLFDQPDLPVWLSPVWWSCIAAALARSSSAGVKRARVALPVSPARQGPSGHGRPHHRAHGKVARYHEEPVPSPPRHRDDGDYTPSEDVDGTTSGSESDRLNSVLSLACFVWFLFGGPLCLGVCGPCGAAGRFPFRGPRLNPRFFAVLMILGATTSDHRAFGGRQVPS
jgi:hypothetical protein